MKKKKLSLNKLFQNNKFLIILALVISTITWVYMSMHTVALKKIFLVGIKSVYKGHDIFCN